MNRSPFVLLSLALLTACASAPKPLQGEFAVLAPSAAADAQGSVRWGGRILSTTPTADRTCFEVLGQALSAQARPLQRDQSIGRFIACRTGFYDPAIFAVDREITVVGQLNGSRERAIGEFNYRYPLVEAEVIYLWPERLPVLIEPVPVWWGYYGPGWGGYWGIHHVLRPRIRMSAPPLKDAAAPSGF